MDLDRHLPEIVAGDPTIGTGLPDVIRGDGGLGGYRWGLDRKRALIDRERAVRSGTR